MLYFHPVTQACKNAFDQMLQRYSDRHISPGRVMLNCSAQNPEQKISKPFKSVIHSAHFQFYSPVSPMLVCSLISARLPSFLISCWARHSFFRPPTAPLPPNMTAPCNRPAVLLSLFQHRSYTLGHSHGPAILKACTVGKKVLNNTQAYTVLFFPSKSSLL